MKIVVVGGGFVNKGAQAMLMTVQSELMRRLPGLELHLWLPRDTDLVAAWTSGFKPIPLYPYGRSGFKRFKKDLSKRVSITFREGPAKGLKIRTFDLAALQSVESQVADLDGVVDISGFAYGDVWGDDCFGRISPLIQYARKKGKPVVFLPQAWGTFEKKKLRVAVRENLLAGKTSFYSRDDVSGEALEKVLGLPSGSVRSHADIAFAFRGGEREAGLQILRGMGCKCERPIVGFSPNMRVYSRSKGASGENAYLQALSTLIRHVLDNYDVDVVLQANEISDDGKRGADDRFLCSLVAVMVNRPSRCFTSRMNLSAEESKALIGVFDFLVSSRFHSIVFALSQGVPCMAIGWSHKYLELLTLFGLRENVVDYKEGDPARLIDCFDRAYAERETRRGPALEKACLLAEEVSALFDEVAAKFNPAGAVKRKSVASVVADGLCTQCGTCEAACPSDAVSLAETAAGLLLPVIDDAKCTVCGVCLKVCPGPGIDLGTFSGSDPFAGRSLGAFMVSATDEAIRRSGQSGGAATAFSLQLLASGTVESVVVAAMSRDGSFRPKSYVASNATEIGAAQGSLYCPVGSGRRLGGKGPIAMVGLPCQMEAIETAKRNGHPIGERVECRIGLFCDRTLTYSCIDQMIADAGLSRDSASYMAFRSKERAGWPGEVLIALKNGEKRFFDSGLRTGLKDFFTPPRCRLCFDKMNIFADLVVGDPWGVGEVGADCSLVLVRTEKGRKLLEDAVASGMVSAVSVEVDKVLESQHVGQRRKSWSAFIRAWREGGRRIPEFKGLKAEKIEDRKYLRKRKDELEFNVKMASASGPGEIARLVSERRSKLGGKGKARGLSKILWKLKNLFSAG